MKKRCLLIFIFVIMISAAGCGTQEALNDDEKLKIVAAGFAEYDWVREITDGASEHVELSMLLDDGVDLHSFQPSVEDMIMISEADLFIYISAADRNWVEEAAANAANENQVVINLLETPGLSLYAAEDEHSEEHSEEHIHPEAAEDEHIWLSLKNAVLLCRSVSEMIQQLDPENKELYAENTEKYLNELKDLDEEFQHVVDTAEKEALLFCDRFPFRYLVRDYDLKVSAAFEGCSTDTEASFETIARLSDFASLYKIDHMLIIEGSDDALAQTVIQNTGMDADILTLHSMQSVERSQTGDMKYIEVMKKNLNMLETALN